MNDKLKEMAKEALKDINFADDGYDEADRAKAILTVTNLLQTIRDEALEELIRHVEKVRRELE